MGKRKVFESQYDDIVRKYQVGSSSTELGKEYGVGPSTILDILRASEVKIRTPAESNRKLSEGQVDDVVRKYQAGINSIELGKEYGVSDQTIRNLLTNRGVEIRGPSEANKKKPSQRQIDAEEEKKRGFLEYLKTKPDATSKDVRHDGFGPELYKFYDGRINRAKRAAGIDEKFIRTTSGRSITESRKQKMLEYIEKNPDVTKEDVSNAGFGSELSKFYNGSINAVKKDVGIGEEHFRKHEEISEKRKVEFLNWLKEHQKATKQDIYRAGFGVVFVKFYRDRPNEAKKAAGIDEKFMRRHERRANQKPASEENRQRLLNYLEINPEATKKEICEAGFQTVLSMFYRGRVNEAKREIKIDKSHVKEFRPITEERRQELLDYLRKKPDVTKEDICNAGFLQVLRKFYKDRMNDAKRAAEIDEKFIRGEHLTEEDKHEFLDWLIENPRATKDDISDAGFITALHKFYNGSPNAAKRDVGIDKKYRNHERVDDRKELAKQLL